MVKESLLSTLRFWIQALTIKCFFQYNNAKDKIGKHQNIDVITASGPFWFNIIYIYIYNYAKHIPFQHYFQQPLGSLHLHQTLLQ